MRFLHPLWAAGLAAFMACNGTEGCAPAESPEGSALRAELAVCAAKAETVQDSCRCRKAVETKHGLCPDAGGQRCGC